MQTSDPNARIIVFDGICHVCSGWVRFLHRHQLNPPFQFIPMQSDAGRALLADYGIDPEDPATFLVLDHGRQLTQSDAAIHVLSAVGGLWRMFEMSRIIPRSWRDALYRTVARNRYRWFGRRNVCYLP